MSVILQLEQKRGTKKKEEDPEPEFQEHEVEAQSGDIRSGDDRRGRCEADCVSKRSRADS